jgi:hypothetical protein
MIPNPPETLSLSDETLVGRLGGIQLRFLRPEEARGSNPLTSTQENPLGSGGVCLSAVQFDHSLLVSRDHCGTPACKAALSKALAACSEMPAAMCL